MPTVCELQMYNSALVQYNSVKCFVLKFEFYFLIQRQCLGFTTI